MTNKQNNKWYDCNIMKPKWYEKLLLLFIKPQYSNECSGSLTCRITYKVLFGKIYVVDVCYYCVANGIGGKDKWKKK